MEYVFSAYAIMLLVAWFLLIVLSIRQNQTDPLRSKSLSKTEMEFAAIENMEREELLATRRKYELELAETHDAMNEAILLDLLATIERKLTE